MGRFASLQAFFLALLAGPAAAQISPDPEPMQWPPHLIWSDFRFGERGEGVVRRVASPLKGRPPLAIWIPAPPGLSGDIAFDTGWLYSFVFDRRVLPMSISYKVEGEGSAAVRLEGVVRGIAEIVRRGPALGYDASRIVLVGRGWGANAAALLATDPRWLEAEGVEFASVAGVLLLHPTGLDLSRPPRSEAWRKAIDAAFGGEAERPRLAPLTHAGAPNAPAFLLLTPPGDEEGMSEAAAFAAALAAAGTRVEVRTPKRSRPYIWSSHIGHPTNAEYGPLKRFFEAALPRRR